MVPLSFILGRTASIFIMEECDDPIMSRISLRDISRLSDSCFDGEVISTSSNYHDERKWRLSYLKNQFESFKLNKMYETYTEKINHGYFSLFLILQCILSSIHLVVLGVVTEEDSMHIILPDVISYSTILILSIAGLCIVDRIAEKYHKLHYLSICVFGIVLFCNNFLPYYHSTDGRYKPAYSAHIALSCYLFFGIQNLMVAFLMGFSVSLLDVITSTSVTYAHDSNFWKRVVSDIMFLVFINGLGMYYRFMNEIVIRRSFLDRRDYIMSTHQLKHEELQVVRNLKFHKNLEKNMVK
ncbi:hypothetical protein JTB14_030660 [Gonioctena quinquepunctata]|nr:hypothetical protein JTB14_030660 [Gonioctena quinquepunctata]